MAKHRLGDAAAARVARIHEAIEEKPAELTGSRGGTTTVIRSKNRTLLRKTSYFEPAEWEAIRRRAEADQCTAAEIVRRSVRSYLDL